MEEVEKYSATTKVSTRRGEEQLKSAGHLGWRRQGGRPERGMKEKVRAGVEAKLCSAPQCMTCWDRCFLGDFMA
jgi:hypothetical protein